MTTLCADAPPARRTAPPLLRPEGFAPEYDAFEPRFADTDRLVLVMLGIEDRGGDSGPARARLLATLIGEDAPDVIEHGRVRPGYGGEGEVWFAYWRTPSRHDAWAARTDVAALLAAAPRTGPIGLWRETCVLALDHNETSYSRTDDLTGIAHLSDALAVTPVHGYWGSARDRIDAAATDRLDAAPLAWRTVDALGRRIAVRAPENMCLIRTSQDINRAHAEQLACYRDEVEPTLMGGLDYLRANGEVSGCAGMRFVDEHDRTGAPAGRTCGIGFFVSLGALEAWTHHHVTHERIMTAFVGMVRRFGGEPGLHLWHEITVFRAGDLTGEYVNCIGDGGLMRVGR